MDALLAYDSTDSEDEQPNTKSTPGKEKEMDKKLNKSAIKTSPELQMEKIERPTTKNQDLSHNLLTQSNARYNYSQFNHSLISFNGNQRWIPSNLLPKTSINNGTLDPEELQFGPQRSDENERHYASNNYIGTQTSAVGPVRRKEDVSDRKDCCKSRPYISKRERENVAYTYSNLQTGNDLVGSTNSHDNKSSSSSSVYSTFKTSKTSNFQLRPYIPKRERERVLQNTIPSTENSLVVSEYKTANSSAEITDAIAICNDKCNDESIESKPDSSLAIVNKPPKRVLYQFNGHSKCVNGIRWSPVKHDILASASMDSTIGLWDTRRNGLCLSRLSVHQAAVKDVKWASCGTQLLSCGFDKSAKLVDVETGKVISNFPHRQFVTCVQYHPTDGNLFLAGTSRNGIYCWDTRLQKIVSEFQAPFGQVQDIAFLPGGEEFVSAAEVLRRNSTDKGIMVWDFRTTAIMSNQIYQEAFTCTCLKVHPSGTFFGAQSNADYIALFATKRPYKLNKYKRYEGHQVSAYVLGFDFSPDGSITVSGSADGNMYIYNSNTSHLISTIPAHKSVCMDVSYNHSVPSMVATCSFDGQIALLV